MNDTTQFHVNVCSSVNSPSFIIMTFPSNAYILNQIAVCVVNCVLIIPAILLNGVCVLTILKSSQLKIKVCYFLILIQSLVDLAVATVSIPSFTYLIYSELVGTANCIVIFLLTIIGLVPCGLSLAALCALTFERYMGVLHPIAHRNILTRGMFTKYICAFTLTMFIVSPIGAISAIVYYVGMIAVISVSLALNAFAYTKIFVSVARRVRPKNSRKENSTEAKTDHGIRRLRFLRETKLARSCAMVVVTFYLCYLPGLVVMLYYFETDKLKYRVAHSWYVTNFAVNASVNSLIFFWKRPLLRKEASKMLKNVCNE